MSELWYNICNQYEYCPKKTNLFFFTGHRHFKSYLELLGDILHLHEKLQEHSHFILHNNNPETCEMELWKWVNPNIFHSIIHTKKNMGIRLGALEQLADSFEIFKDYEIVVHLHPDVYIINENRILEEILYFSENPSVFAVCPGHNEYVFTTDFFMFKPNRIKNIFLDWKKYHSEPPPRPKKDLQHWVADHECPWRNPAVLSSGEYVFKTILESHNLSYYIMDRYPIGAHHPDDLGLWHCHTPHRMRDWLNKFKLEVKKKEERALLEKMKPKATSKKPDIATCDWTPFVPLRPAGLVCKPHCSAVGHCSVCS